MNNLIKIKIISLVLVSKIFSVIFFRFFNFNFGTLIQLIFGVFKSLQNNCIWYTKKSDAYLPQSVKHTTQMYPVTKTSETI